MTGVPEVAGHAIQTLTVDLAPQTRTYFVSLRCACGRDYPSVTACDLSGVLDVGIQMFFTHLASMAEVE